MGQHASGVQMTKPREPALGVGMKNSENSLVHRALKRSHTGDRVEVTLDYTTIENNGQLRYSANGFDLELAHLDADPSGVNRLHVRNRRLEVEILPSKGLSIGEAFVVGSHDAGADNAEKGKEGSPGRPIFWKPPLAGLPDPKNFHASDPILVDGELVEGVAYIGAMYGGIELLGLYNWGMPQRNSRDELLPLHGDAANVPVDVVRFVFSDAGCEIQGEFFSRDHLERERLFRITKGLVLEPGSTRILTVDTVENITNRRVFPDWGYHVNVRPVHRAEYLVPSKAVQIRGNSRDMEKHRIWHAATVESVREEYGLIRKIVRVEDGVLMGDPGTRSVVVYPDGSGTIIVTPPVPYFQSWYSAGGVNGTCFTLPDKSDPGDAIFLKNGWNGMGAEIGSSALDHDGNTDRTVAVRELAPGQSTELKLIVEVLERPAVQQLATEIREYNDGQEVL